MIMERFAERSGEFIEKTEVGDAVIALKNASKSKSDRQDL